MEPLGLGCVKCSVNLAMTRQDPTRDADASREIDDFTLIRAQRGDRSAQAAVVRCYERRVGVLVARLLAGQPDLVEDVAQDAFIRILSNLDRFDRRGAARLSTWALTIATRVAIDRMRRRRTERGVVDDRLEAPVETDPAGLENATARRALGRRVAAVMAELPDEHRAVLVLRAYHDLDYDEIAIALGLEEGTVKSRLSRARDALKRVLGGG